MHSASNKKLLDYLQRPRAIVTLLHLLESTKQGLDYTLTQIGGSKRTGMSRINELVEMGLASKQTELAWHRRRIYVLSEDGQKIAVRLRELLNYWTEFEKRRRSREV